MISNKLWDIGHGTEALVPAINFITWYSRSTSWQFIVHWSTWYPIELSGLIIGQKLVPSTTHSWLDRTLVALTQHARVDYRTEVNAINSARLCDSSVSWCSKTKRLHIRQTVCTDDRPEKLRLDWRIKSWLIKSSWLMESNPTSRLWPRQSGLVTWPHRSAVDYTNHRCTVQNTATSSEPVCFYESMPLII